MTNQKQEHVKLFLRDHPNDRQDDRARAVSARAMRLYTKHIRDRLRFFQNRHENIGAQLNKVNLRAL